MRRPSTPCRYPSCSRLVTTPGFCAVHQQARRDVRPSAAQRGYGGEWQRIREQVLTEQPVCARCQVRPARDVHHIRPLRDGGTHQRGNLVGLCRSCHNRVTATEKRVTA